VKPSRDRTATTPSLLHDSVAWTAAALVQDLSQPLTAILLNARVALRSLEGLGAPLDVAAEALRDLVDDAAQMRHTVGDLRTALALDPVAGPVRPEFEIRLAAALVTAPEAVIQVVGEEGPPVMGRPGAVGVAVMHLLLGLSVSSRRVVAMIRRGGRLEVAITGLAGDQTVTAAAAMHLAVCTTVLERLGGRLVRQEHDGAVIEVPLRALEEGTEP